MKKSITVILALCLVLCATVALAANYCINCGEYLAGAYNYCPNCGTRQPGASDNGSGTSGGGPTGGGTAGGTSLSDFASGGSISDLLNGATPSLPTPTPAPSSAMTITSINRTEDGALSVTWSDSGNNGPYAIYALQKRSNSFNNDAAHPVGAQLCQDGIYTTTGLANRIVPGVDYWIIVVDAKGNQVYREYDGGTAPRFNEFTVEASIRPKYRRDNAFEEVYAFSADDIRRYRSSTSYGARIDLEYPQLARERQYCMLIAITNPNGDIVVDVVSEDILYRGHYSYYWNFYTFDEYFDVMSDAYGTVPTGTYTWSLYYDGRFVTSDTFRITY